MEDSILQFNNNSNFVSNLYSENKEQYENLYKECYPVVSYTNRFHDFIVDLFSAGLLISKQIRDKGIILSIICEID